MGILQVDPRQEGKKVLPKKPKQNNAEPTESDFSDQLFSDYLTPEWEEAFLTATSSENVRIESPEEAIMNKTEEPMMNSSEQALMNTPELALMNTLEHTIMNTSDQDMINTQDMLDTLEPMMVEEDNYDSVWDFNVDVDNVSTAPPEANVIADNNIQYETHSLLKQESEELDDCWGLTSFHAPASMVEGICKDEKNATEIDSIYNMDIVQFALGESGLDEFLLPSQDTPIVKVEDSLFPTSIQETKATTSSFIHGTNNMVTIDPSTISLILPSIQPYSVSTFTSHPTLKRKAGRPERQTPIAITEIPKKGSVTEDELRSSKYRRSRDLNNEASKRCRKNRKDKNVLKEHECEDMAEKNRELAKRMQAMEAEVEAWKAKCRAIGYCC